MDTNLEHIEGGVTAACGFNASAVHAGFRRDPRRLDVALVVADEPAVAAGVFTRNVFCAAPVKYSREVVASGSARAVIINSGNANAATGEPGAEAVLKTADLTANALGIAPSEVLIASTGVIGVQLNLKPYEKGLPELVETLSKQGAHNAACAILTTDTCAKECAVSYVFDGVTYKLGGMAKGSGMIQPNMATMIAVLTSDVNISHELAQEALRAAVNTSFNKITVDSDTSTNDTCLFMASGAAKGPEIEAGTPAYDAFFTALKCVCEGLARKMAIDGEGATKLVTVNVRNAKDEADADAAARTIANSPLVKTAIAGHDCNWGRIAAALGRSGADFEAEKVDIDIMGLPVCRHGLTVGFDEKEALDRFEEDEIVIDVNLNAGLVDCRIWTCDLTHEYIHINADYRS